MKISDEKLARLTSKGNEKAFEEILRRYGGLIKAIVYYHLSNISMWQDDCINDVLLKIWQNIDRFNPQKSTLKNWIGAVAKYRAIDYKRKYCRELITGELNENIADERCALLQNEIKEEVDSLLENLSAEDREIFIQRYIMDRTVDDIARSQERTTGYIYNRLSRGRKKLRRLFAKERL